MEPFRIVVGALPVHHGQPLVVTLPELGNFRWLTVGPAAQQDVAVVLMAIPGPPVMDEATAVVLPYRKIESSGVLATARSYNQRWAAPHGASHKPDGEEAHAPPGLGVAMSLVERSAGQGSSTPSGTTRC